MTHARRIALLLALLVGLTVATPAAAEQSAWFAFLTNEEWTPPGSRSVRLVWAPPTGQYRTRLMWLIAAFQAVSPSNPHYKAYKADVTREMDEIKRLPPGPRGHYMAKLIQDTTTLEWELRWSPVAEAGAWTGIGEVFSEYADRAIERAVQDAPQKWVQEGGRWVNQGGTGLGGQWVRNQGTWVFQPGIGAGSRIVGGGAAGLVLLGLQQYLTRPTPADFQEVSPFARVRQAALAEFLQLRCGCPDTGAVPQVTDVGSRPLFGYDPAGGLYRTRLARMLATYESSGDPLVGARLRENELSLELRRIQALPDAERGIYFAGLAYDLDTLETELLIRAGRASLGSYAFTAFTGALGAALGLAEIAALDMVFSAVNMGADMYQQLEAEKRLRLDVARLRQIVLGKLGELSGAGRCVCQVPKVVVVKPNNDNRPPPPPKLKTYVYVRDNEWICCKDKNETPKPIRVGPLDPATPGVQLLSQAFDSDAAAKEWLCRHETAWPPGPWAKNYSRVGGVLVANLPCPRR